MVQQRQEPWLVGRGVGRGRAMAQPPGFRGPVTTASLPGQQNPGGLAQPWMPGPAIPEDEEDVLDPTDPATLVAAVVHSSSISPAISSPASTYRRHPTSYASYIATPDIGWATQTPSEPLELDPESSDSPALGAGLPAAGL